MKKVVFTGTINGKEFSNVIDYNKEMMKVMASGENVQANSSTHTVYEDETECPEEKECSKLNYFPLLNTDNQFDFLDEMSEDLFNDNEEERNRKIEGLLKFVDDSFEEVKPVLKHWSKSDLDIYFNQLATAFQMLKSINKRTDQTSNQLSNKYDKLEMDMASLEKEMDKIEKNLDFLERCQNLTSSIGAKYNQMLNIVKNTTPALNTTDIKVEEKKPQIEKTFEDMLNDILFND